MDKQAFSAELPQHDPLYTENESVAQYTAGWMHADNGHLVLRYAVVTNAHKYPEDTAGAWQEMKDWGEILLFIFAPIWSLLFMFSDDEEDNNPYEVDIKTFRTIRMPITNIEHIKTDGFFTVKGVEFKLQNYPEKHLLPGQQENLMKLEFPVGQRTHAESFLNEAIGEVE